MLHIWHEWKNKRDNLKSIETERKAANKRIWNNLNEELRVARKNRDWDKANNLKMHISNYKYEKRGYGTFYAQSGFSKWDY